MNPVRLLVGSTVAILASNQIPKHRVVMELDRGGEIAYLNALESAHNLVKAFSPQNLRLEIVCRGEGLDMLLANRSKMASRIPALEKIGVRFAACGNTLSARHIKPTDLMGGVAVVDSGLAEVVRKEEGGWAYLKM